MDSIELLDKLPTEIAKCIKANISTADKVSLSAALIDISLEHYYSVSILVRSNLYGSAAALIRPQMESRLMEIPYEYAEDGKILIV